MDKSRKLNGKEITKRIVKLLAVINSPAMYQQVIKHSPDSVIKTICNAALTAQKGNIQLGGGKRRLFSQQRKKIYKLTNPRVSINAKRQVLLQRGGFAWLPLLLSTVLGAVGSGLFERLRQ